MTGYDNGKGGIASPLAGTEITAVFAEDGTLAGSAGCNNYEAFFETGGDPSAAGGSISIGQVATTRRMCSEPTGIMEQEMAYLTALALATAYETLGDVLELRNSEGTPMATYAVKATAQGAVFDQETLKNMTYSSEWAASGSAALVDGEYREQAASGSATETIIRLTDLVAWGDLKGQAAAAVILAADPRGSGTFYDLGVVVAEDGQPVNIATTPLGDRVQIRSLVIKNSQVVVEMTTHGPVDPMCCPTQRVVQSYGLQGDQLTQISSELVGTGAGGASELVGKAWYWNELIDPVQGPQGIDRPDRYTVTFQTNGRVGMEADCNYASGSYTTEGANISITIGPVTLAHCGPDSLSDQFIRHLGSATVYQVEGGALLLDLPADSGTLRLSRDR